MIDSPNSGESAEKSDFKEPEKHKNQSFPPENRIRKRSEFQNVYSGGHKSARRFVVVYAKSREKSDLPTRLGLTASKKIGKANVRNRIRRRLREIFRSLHSEIKPGQDIVINTRVAVVRADFWELREEFIRCLQDLKLISTAETSGDMSSNPSTESSESS